ncbi:MAG TPA: serine/threonine-protein kinase, partial [Vicinamibacterales bacterium]|nr:serine/threonine-protein kinase [Vicinamibacterales bacterium]
HRDFKPANVMLDGTGRVRITDFGLAGVSGEALRAGTPAYMAPEQLAGQEVTARSDLYALGLVLYELFTGRRALDGTSLAEIIRRREQGDIPAPSALARDLSPELDGAIMRCLAVDPAARPPSALAVAAALPGGDPLAAALAAGETPSPEMVAAAGDSGAAGRTAGMSLLAFVLAGLCTLAYAASNVALLSLAPLEKSAEVLEDRARELLARIHPVPAADQVRGVSVNSDVLRWIASTDVSPRRWDVLATGELPVVRFWYRTSPRELLPVSSTTWLPTYGDPPLVLPGMAAVMLDERGRLIELVTVPPQKSAADTAVPPTDVDWTPLFEAAGLRMHEFGTATPQWNPPVHTDTRAAWEGPLPWKPDTAVRVEAGTYGGRPATFKVIGPWTQPISTDPPRPPSARIRFLSLAGALLVLALLVGALVLVRFNLRSGRADRRGAARIALFLIWVSSAAWLLGADHSLNLDTELELLFRFLSGTLLNAGLTWLFYLALEPFIRRFNPDMLISWSRLLAGQLRDPRVGRDVLIGLAAGVYLALAGTIDNFLPQITGAAPPQPHLTSTQFLLGTRFGMSSLLRMVPNAMQGALIATFAFVMLRAIVGRRDVAIALASLLFIGVIAAEDGGDPTIWLLLVFAAAIVLPVMFVFVRFGVLPLATTILTNQMLSNVPLTVDLARANAGVSTLTILLLASAAVYAFHVSRAGEGLFRRLVPA